MPDMPGMNPRPTNCGPAITPPPTPAAPYEPQVATGYRGLQERLRETAAAIDRSRQGGPPDIDRILVKIYDGGAIPTQPLKVFLGHPVEIDATDIEGSVPTFSPDTTQTIPTVLVRGVAKAGDYLVAHAIAGRWAAERGGGCQACFTVVCGGAPVNGATVTVKSGSTTIAAGTTSSSGLVCLAIPSAGTYTVSASGSTCTGVSKSLALACGGNYTLQCCCAACASCPAPAGNLTLSYNMTTRRAGTLTLITSTPGSVVLTPNPSGCSWQGPVYQFNCDGSNICIPTTTPVGTWVFNCDAINGKWDLISTVGSCTGGSCTWLGSTATSYSCSPFDISYKSHASFGLLLNGCPLSAVNDCFYEDMTVTP